MMEQIYTIQEGLLRLFQAGQRPAVDFTYEKATSETLCDHITVDGERYPVFDWRYSKKCYGIYAWILRPTPRPWNRSCFASWNWRNLSCKVR